MTGNSSTATSCLVIGHGGNRCVLSIQRLLQLKKSIYLGCHHSGLSGLWFSRPIFHFDFGLTHFTFVNFSYPYDTNLCSYLSFILKLCFQSDRSHHEEGVRRRLDSAGGSTNEEDKLLSSNDEGRTLHQPRIKSSSHSKPLFFVTTLFPLRALHPVPNQH